MLLPSALSRHLQTIAGLISLLARSEASMGVLGGERGDAYPDCGTAAEALMYLIGAPLSAFVGGAVFFWVRGQRQRWTAAKIGQLNTYPPPARGIRPRHVRGARAACSVGSHTPEEIKSDAPIVAAEVLDSAHLRAMNHCRLLAPIVSATLVVRLTDLRIEGTEDFVALLAGYSVDSIARRSFAGLNRVRELFAPGTGASTP